MLSNFRHLIDLLEPKNEFSVDYTAKVEGCFVLDTDWSMY